jgi:glycosyltransferase involved in cell wall biosynthesis
MPDQKPHIVIVCSRLDLPGGIERAVVNNANLFQSKGHKVTIVIPDVSNQSFYPINHGVNIEQLPLHFGITETGNIISRKIAFYKHIQKLKKLFQKIDADVLIGTEYSLTIVTYLAARKLNAKIFAWEHHHFHWLKKNRFWSFLFHKVYPKLDLVVCNNRTEKGLFENVGCKATVIPYVVPENDKQIAPLNTKEILTIGWLIKRKGVDLIPAIAEKIFEKHKDWKWKIIGSGEEFDNLQQQIQEKNLQNLLVIEKPKSHQLDEEYLNASIYVMTSRFECLPMVLLEATSHGLPGVAFDCPTGPRDIITNEVDGYVTPLEDVDAMATAIEDLIMDEEKRKRMGQEAFKSSKRYSPERIYQLWSEVF